MVAAFEDAVAEYVGAKFAVAVSSGTAALHIASHAAGLREGRTLITSPITFVASANAAFYCGAEPRFSDIDPHTVNMSPDRLEEGLSRAGDVGVIMPVHYGGLPCDMERICAIADKAGVVVVEDAAHAIGARYADGARVGSGRHGAMTAFSFHPVKAIAAGEGGMVTTNDERLYRSLLRLRSHGINKLDDKFEIQEQAVDGGQVNPWYYEMQELGFHYRITDIQCALALSQLKKIDRFLARRRELAATYDRAFAAFQNLRPAQPMNRERSGLHIYVVRIDFKAIGRSRGDLMRALRERGIGSQVHYVPVPNHPYFRKHGASMTHCPAAAAFYQEALSIPLYFDLSDAEQQSVIASLKELVG
jgi:UDP-4-amino-4,6-dideoxy-N-acetyl-beta-L-altrosamine transaminase